MNRIASLAVVLFALIATGAHAGGPLGVCNDAGRTPIKYSGAGTVNLRYDLGPLGTRSKAQADAIVASAVALWTNVGTASITIGRGADLPVDVTTANVNTYDNVFGDMVNPVIYDTDGSIIDLLLGAGNKSSVLGFAGSGFSHSTCLYAEGQAVISGFLPISDTSMGITIAHEIGHLIGMDHTQLNATQGIALTNRPLMYPIVNRNTVTLHEDDESAVSALYPDATLNTVYGEISGTFVLADGTTPVRGANLWATETTTNKVYSIVSDYRMQNTGFFRLLLPLGTYNLRAGTISTGFTGGSSVGPYSENAAGLSFQAPLYNGGVAMTDVTLGNGTPTAFNITPGCAATLTFRINGAGTVGGNCAPAGSFALNVVKAPTGTGSGTVTSAPGGINCGATCSAFYASGTMVTLTATPTGGSSFAGWSGACSGTGDCTVAMNSTTNVTATFLPAGTSSEVFPAACQLPLGWTVPGTAASGWDVTFSDSAQGVCSLKSNTIGDNQKAQIQFTGTFSAGTISFMRRVSSEAGYDCFRFFIDNAQQDMAGTCSGLEGGEIGASGEVSWAGVNVAVSAGVHTLLWSFEKDLFVSAGQDAAYIDQVVLPINTGTLQLTAGTASVSESAGNAVISVSRTGGSSGTASVNFATTGITATAGADFTAQTGLLNWADGDSANKTITVPITSDALVEGNETFSILLSSPVGATLGATTNITVTITDDDFLTAPDAPTIGIATPGNAVASIAFTAPGSNGGSAILDYTVTCGGGSSPAIGLASPITVTGLTNNQLYTCSVTARNAIGTSIASGTVNVTPMAGAALALVSVKSRKAHGGLGSFDVPINAGVALAGPVSVEPRSSTSHAIVFRMNNTVTVPGSASVVDAGGPIGNASSPVVGADTRDVIVTLTGIPDNKRVTVTLTGVNGAFNISASMGFLVGDVNSNRAVNASDISAVKARQSQTVNNDTTALNDLIPDGAINQSDVSAAKARSGRVIP